MTTSESDGQGAEAEDPDQALADRAAALVDRIQADENLDLEAYARALPEPLRALLPAIARMAGLKRKSALSGVLEGCPWSSCSCSWSPTRSCEPPSACGQTG